MFFDDRLATVLRQRASSDVGLRTQFRQLLDILGTERPGIRAGRDQSLVAAAWLRMDALAAKIPSAARARMIREAGWRFRNPQLAAHLADFEPEVASAALSRAQLSAEDWTALIPRLPVRARGFLRLRKDLPVDVEDLLERLGVHDRGLPRPAEGTYEVPVFPDEAEVSAPAYPVAAPSDFDDLPDESFETDADDGIEADEVDPLDIDLAPLPTTQAADPSAPLELGEDFEIDPVDDPDDESRSEISALVERIAQFRRSREAGSEQGRDLETSEPRLPLGEDAIRSRARIAAFGFSADAGGRIEWADPEVASMVVGTRLAAPPRIGSGGGASAIERALARRQPVAGAPFTLAGADAIAGDWIVSGEPRFTDSGVYAGFIGRFRRPPGDDPDLPTPAQREADRIRQLLHELRTPVTAVQGYAEVIQQQLFGSAPHEYRALAAVIAADAARILSGFEELDRLARLETGAAEIEAGEADLCSLVDGTASQLGQVLGPRMAGIECEVAEDTRCLVALAADEAEALIWRLLATLGGGCAAGEVLIASLDNEDQFARLTCEIPAQLLGEEDIFTADARPIGTTINAGLFGAGFALRLARAEAQSVGGTLVREEEALVLTLPLVGTDERDSEASETPQFAE